MNDRQLRTFVTLADCGTLSRAEAILFTSRQALKKQIDALEAEAHAELFIRGARGYALTPAGRIFYEGAVEMLTVRERVLGQIDAGKGMVLRIGAMAGGTPRLLLNITAEFARAYPNCSVEIVGMPFHELPEACIDGRVDLFSGGMRGGEAKGLSYTCLGPVANHCLMAKNHPLALLESVGLADLDGQEIGVLSLDAYGRLAHALDERGRGAVVREIGADAYAISNFCYAGHIGLFNSAIAEEFGRAFSIVPLNFDCDVNYGFVHRSLPEQPVREFLQTAARVFKSRHAQPVC